MTLPTLQVLVAFATAPLASPTYVDITAYVRSLRIRRGRNNELNRIETSTATLELDNADRRFEPFYSGSPYYPNVIPTRRIQIRAVWAGVTYYLFTGFISGWPLDWDHENGDSHVKITAYDQQALWGRAQPIAVSFGAQKASASIATVLGFMSPVGGTAIEDGISTLQPYATTAGGIEIINKLTESENGFFWIGPSGNAVWANRYHRLNNGLTPAAVFGPGVGESSYVKFQPIIDDTFLYSRVTVTRQGGTTQTAFNSSSSSAYGSRTLAKSGLLMSTDGEALDAAMWLLRRYEQPGLRGTLELHPSATNEWPVALGLDFNQRITVKRAPPGVASIQSADFYIEGVEHEFRADANLWITRFNLSPVQASGSETAWVLDDAVFSVLGTTTILAY